tara:strand:- start:3021 stop:3761 length:741 start_codon:yes stop_codon:yes gene_type:complete
MYFGVDPAVIGTLVDPGSGQSSQQSAPTAPEQLNDEHSQFIAAVLGDTETTWHSLFESKGGSYEEPRLVLFSDSVRSACGFAQAAMGPFYCPADQKVYLDLSFFDDLGQRYGAPGDFAQAYVIAHEVGHHVQTLLGVSAQVQQQGQGRSEAEVNALSVRQELQADCFAGIWAHNADQKRSLLEAGDLEEGLAAASAVGDDRLQKRSQGYIVPESFTHGTSQQRMDWFKRGYSSGRVEDCDTFSDGG